MLVWGVWWQTWTRLKVIYPHLHVLIIVVRGGSKGSEKRYS